jgi:hypothetical protein
LSDTRRIERCWERVLGECLSALADSVKLGAGCDSAQAFGVATLQAPIALLLMDAAEFVTDR